MIENVSLPQVYKQIQARLSTLDFERIWQGFKPLDFALYDDETVTMKERSFPRTDAFMGNTAIFFEGGWLAIWYLPKPMDLNRLCAQLVHEMFHAFQHESGERRFPNELEALFKMKLDSAYLDLKYAENQALLKADDTGDVDHLNTMVALRTTRQNRYPEPTQYENQVEVIEGCAKFVELQALKQLDQTQYTHARNQLIKRISDPANLLPTRILSYDIGGLILETVRRCQVQLDTTIGQSQQTVFDHLKEHLNPAPFTEAVPAVSEQVLHHYQARMQGWIDEALTAPLTVIEGDFKLVGCNVYSAQYLEPFLYSSYFIMLEDGTVNRVEQGTFICEMRANRVVKLYKIKDTGI